MRTPLNAIINFMEMVLEGPLDKETRDNLSRSHIASKSLIYAINDLLDLTQTEHGHDLVKEEEFDLIQAAYDTVNAFNGDIEKKGLMIDVHVPDNFPKVVKGDEMRIRQCISNLLSNAVKYTDQGGITAELQIVDITEAGKVNIEISVQDTGIGMTAEDMDILFRQLEQVQINDELSLKAKSHEAGGGYMLTKSSTKKLLGLGIAKVGRIIQTMGGQLRVTSEKGKGSRFTMQIPLSLAASSSGSHDTPLLLPWKEELGNGLEVMPVDYNAPITRQVDRPQLSRRASYEKLSTPDVDRLLNAVRGAAPVFFPVAADEENLERGGVEPAMPSNVLERVSQPNLPRVLDLQKDEPVVAAPITTISTVVTASSAQITGVVAAPSANVSTSASTAMLPMIGATQTAAVEPSPVSKQLMEKESDDKCLSILVAEDDSINSLIIQKRMERLGHNVKLTVNGQQCADAFKIDRDKYDLVLMDMQVSSAFLSPPILRV